MEVLFGIGLVSLLALGGKVARDLSAPEKHPPAEPSHNWTDQQVISEGFGLPFVTWDKVTRDQNEKLMFGPRWYDVEFFGETIRFDYVLPRGGGVGLMARVSGGDTFSRQQAQDCILSVQQTAARVYGKRARAAYSAYLVEHEAEQELNRWKVAAEQEKIRQAARLREAQCEEARQQQVRRFARLNAPIRLKAAGTGIVFGTDVISADDLVLPVSDIPHLLVVGTSGFGKSVFLHQLVSQLSTSPEVEQLMLVDLKGGVEFDRYAGSGNKVRVVWQYADVLASVDTMITLLHERQALMRQQGIRTWRGGRVFFVVDEFAQVQLWPITTKEEKATHSRLIADLTRLSMLGRSMGIVIVAAIQKPTTDVMDSSFRTNLQGQVCFRVASRLFASSIFPDLDELPADPMTLPRGRYHFYNANTGKVQLVQAHVAPEAAE